MRILRISSRQRPQRVGRQAAYVSSDFHVIIDSFLYTTSGSARGQSHGGRRTFPDRRLLLLVIMLR